MPDTRPVGREPQPVQVRIGTVEVRLGEQATAGAQPQQSAGPAGFDDYAAVRGYA